MNKNFTFCPICYSENVFQLKETMKESSIIRYKCKNCNKSYTNYSQKFFKKIKKRIMWLKTGETDYDSIIYSIIKSLERNEISKIFSKDKFDELLLMIEKLKKEDAIIHLSKIEVQLEQIKNCKK